MTSSRHRLDIDDVRAAALRIAPYVARTPLRRVDALDRAGRCEVWVKCEHLQRTGSFKSRGAHNAVFSLDDATARRGVTAHSSGNHAAALALAAAMRGVPCWIAMPSDAPATKRANTRRFGASIVECDATMASRRAAVDDIVASHGATEVHPFDDPQVIAGAGTCALEIMESPDVAEMGDALDVVVVPIGGGGLAAGCTIVAAAFGVAMLAVEPSLADDAAVGLRRGVRQPQREPVTVADGLRTDVGRLNFEVLREAGTPVTLVDDDEIVDTHSWLHAVGLPVELSSATAFVPIRRGDFAGARVAVVATGGNTPKPS